MAPSPSGRPSRDELQESAGKEIPDLVVASPRLLLCGINPGLRSGWSGHHFAGPGNRLWPALEKAGITQRRLQAHDVDEIRGAGIAITNLVARATATAAEVTRHEIRAGAERLQTTVRQLSPAAIVVLGMGAYRTAFSVPQATLGRQPESIAGVPVWLAPNPSGLQARYGVEVIAEILYEAYHTPSEPSVSRIS